MSQPSNRNSYLISLYSIAFFRAVTTGFTGVLLGIYLATRGFDASMIGAVVSAGLAGMACSAVFATFLADQFGRRRFLILLTLLQAIFTVAFTQFDTPVLILITAFLSTINGIGRDRGAALILEQAALPSFTTDAKRTKVIAWYTMLQDGGHAIGSLLAGVPAWLAVRSALPEQSLQSGALITCAALTAASALIYKTLPIEFERPIDQFRTKLLPESRKILVKLSALFSIDSIAGGFLTSTLLSYLFFEQFHATAGQIGVLFFLARLLNAASHLLSAWLAKRIGLVNTMVFTHIPSSIFLMTVVIAPNFWVAALLFLLREGLVEMDVPTRQSYVMAVVQPAERTIASGITNLVRLGGWMIAPVCAGWLMSGTSLLLPLLIGGGMKILYDILLWRAFRHVKPPEERVISAR